MCTVSLIAIAGGIRLACNRDEQRARAVASLPQAHLLGRRQAVFPVDPQGGGTWIGVNDAGLAATLLNHHPPAASGASFVGRVTRGRIVPSILATDTFDGALAVTEALRASDFRPFRLVVVAGRAVAELTSDGATLRITHLRLERPMLWTSSSLGDALVEGPRRALFEHIVGSDPDDWPARQLTFHRHQWPDRPHLSVRMARADALTVSFSLVDVGAERAELAYEPYHQTADSPSRVPARLTLALARERARSRDEVPLC